jgi:hypothetical protein
MSRLGGLTARVGQLLEVLPSSSGFGGGSLGSTGPGGLGSTGGRRRDMHAVRLSMDSDGQELQPSQFAALLQPPQLLRCACVVRTAGLPPAPA